MIWWCKARRAHVLLPLGLLSLFVLSLVLQSRETPLPSITASGSAEHTLMSFAPLPFVATLALCLDSRLPAAEISGTRPVRAMDAALTGAALAVAVTMCLLTGLVLDSTTVMAAGRNTVFLAALVLVLQPFAGQGAVLAPATWLIAVALVGFRGPRDPYPWTIVPERAGAPHAALGTVLLLLAAAAIQLRAPRNTP
ncbi:hypothetical protein [Streptomyces sp. RFCAC02]|uniref:hypothetical protein n=1 Tax=Streptomyces sp. RFCAC02 TaxID=2499143 RepID=UPI00101E9FDA|nr:hypothetical protein [Streptomyces sp. RFCAC02]